MDYKKYKKFNVCAWVGDGEGCRQPTVYSKSYCEEHHDRVFLKLLPEMADYIIEKELSSVKGNYDNR